MTLLVKISDIKIGPRFRKDLGDLSRLTNSIKRHGLLHPIVITPDNELVCGRRRLEACTKLGYGEIEVNLVSSQKLNSSSYSDQNFLKLDSSSRLSEAEADENIVRKDFTVEEIAEISEFYREREEAAAKERMLAGKQLQTLEPLVNFPKGRSSANIAAKVGVSYKTLDKIREIKEASDQGPEFVKIWDSVSQNKMSVHQGYKRINDLKTIKSAELEAEKTGLIFSEENYDLKFGPMQERGLEIPDSSIDFLYTDPPYIHDCLPLYDELAKLAQRVLKPGGSLCTYVGHYALEVIIDKIRANSDLKYAWMFVAKHNGKSTKIWNIEVWPGYKPILWYYKPDSNGKPSKFDDVADLIKNDFIESQPVDKTFHKWEQSTIEAEHLIKPLTVKGQVVLDPFMGFGTTGIAALQLNRKFIGIENDKVSYSRAAQRLTNFMTAKVIEN